MKRVVASVLGVVLCVMSGCSGYREDFSCRTNPDSGMCARVSDVYHAGSGGHERGGGPRDTVQSDGFPGVQTKAILGKPLVQAPEVWSLWVKPWEDEQATLHEASTHYVLLERGSFFRYGAKVTASGKSASNAWKPMNSRVVTPYTSVMVEGTERPFSSDRPSTVPTPSKTQEPGKMLPSNFNEQLRQLQERQRAMKSSGADDRRR